ncbi:MAG: hypothetical protein J6A47_05035, partial [Bacilli bacterium]|nr:hypothetical protein [Bacilli bacterium]
GAAEDWLSEVDGEDGDCVGVTWQEAKRAPTESKRIKEDFLLVFIKHLSVFLFYVPRCSKL